MRIYSRIQNTIRSISVASLLLLPLSGETLSIADKKASLLSGGSGDLNQEMQRFLIQVNNELREQRELLRSYYAEAALIFEEGGDVSGYEELLEEINAVKAEIALLEKSWRDVAAQNNQDEEYALWHQPDTTLGDLVIDYGSQDYVYLMSPEIAAIPISINSNIPVPRAEWSEMLDLILNQNGIGVRQLTPYLRQLYLLQNSSSSIAMITNDLDDLDAFAHDTRICFMLSPPASDVRRIWYFLEKFVNPETTQLEMIGRDILIVATVHEIRELTKLYTFVAANSGDTQYKIVPLRRVDAKEMADILSAIFNQFNEEPAQERSEYEYGYRDDYESESSYRGSNGLRVVTLANVAQAIFLLGTPEEIRKAEEIIYQVEMEVGEATEKVIYTYHCRHTDSVELAEILEKVYAMLLQQHVNLGTDDDGNRQNISFTEFNVDKELKMPQELYEDGFYQEGSYIVNPAPVEPGMAQQGHEHPNRGRNNFIVDIKTGAIIMVVEGVILPKMKELIKKLDVPKRMVQIDVLLFEKRAENRTRFGLNLFRLGDDALNSNAASLSFNNISQSPDLAGVLQFCLSRACSAGAAAYDLAFKFLLTQDDVTINANPSIVAVNQTTATLAINEEVSINTGVYQVETAKGVTLKDSFTRAQYGTNIKVTPTIHMHDPSNCTFRDPNDYITLETDITFQTPLPSIDSRPDVINRQVKNVVRIANGQTVILGGLRRKQSRDNSEKIPYLGELPGVGVIFGDTEMEDRSTEMFIFLTPTIICDPSEDMERIKHEELCRRPGDIPCFLRHLDNAREREKKRCLRSYLQMVLGREPERCYTRPGEYHGR